MTVSSWLTNILRIDQGSLGSDHITMRQKAQGKSWPNDKEIRCPSWCRGSLASFSAKINTNSRSPVFSLVPFSCLFAFCAQWSQGCSARLVLVKNFSFATRHNFTHLCALKQLSVPLYFETLKCQENLLDIFKYSCLIQRWIKYHIIHFNIKKLQDICTPPKNSVSARQRDRHLNRETNT